MNEIALRSLESLGVFILGFIVGFFFKIIYDKKKKMEKNF